MKISLVVLLVCLVRIGYGQTYSITDSRAIKMHEQGNELVKGRMYEEAIEKYKSSIQREPDFLESYIKWSRILLTRGNPKEGLDIAIKGESKVSKMPDDLQAELSWLKLHLHLAMGNFEKAIAEFEVSQQFLDPAFKRTHDYLQTRSRIDFLSQQLEKKLTIHKEKLPEPINDFTLQYFPVLTADSKKLLFTKRDGVENHQREDIYVTYYEEEKGWTVPEAISNKINTSHNEGTCTISADGNILIFTSCDTSDSFGSCDLYVAYKVNGQWQQSQNMGKNVNSKSWDSQPSLSADGRILFFSSNRRGGYGGNDIWYSLRGSDGSWMEAKNLGSIINTANDEVSPFIYFNNESLFFASNGHEGFGGMDLFVSRVVHGEFTKPENLGYPINDQQDQFSLFITAQRDYAYYTESHFDGKRIERSFLYRFQFPEEIALGEKLVVSRGKVLNSKTGQPIDAKLSLVKLSNDSTLYEFRSDGKTGDFTMIYPERSFSGLYIEKKGYLPKIYNVERDSLENQENLQISLTPIASGEEFVFENIFFDFDKDELKPESRSSLMRLIHFLRENPEVKILISGHTDNVGSANYNLNLSKRRADVVMSFLIAQGMDASRLTAEGRGDSAPIRPNDNAINRSLNRRITISIL
jgi:outer membrane protein OmpA-like peptidoglycan-associated protein